MISCAHDSCLCIPLCALCCLLTAMGIGATLLALLYKQNSTSTITTTTTTTTTMTTTTTTTLLSSKSFCLNIYVQFFVLDFNINVVRNGDAETGPCSVSGELPGPSIWKYNGNVTQLSYSDPVTISQRVTSPGPRYRKPIIFHAYNVLFFSDRGNCYFCGGYGAVSSMWQTVNLSHYIDLYYIDNQIAKYNLSAWIGGLTNQDDNGALSLRFLDQFNQIIGSVVALGPILAADRRNITKLVPCQTQGVIPLGTYFFKIEVIFNLVNGGFNNGNIDNIAVTIYA